MHEFHQLGSLVIIFALTLPISYIFHRLNCPAVVGYILGGVLIGPHSLGLIDDASDIEILSEIGIILLLFTVGMELSLSTLLKNLKTVLASGMAQFHINLGIFTAAGLFMGLELKQTLFLSSLLALSSTAIVLKAYTDRGELDTFHGQICAGVLLFQDLLVIPLMLIAPFLTGVEELNINHLSIVLLKSFAGISAIFLTAKLAVPRMLNMFIKLRDREMMLLLLILICMLGAWGAQEFGLSLAMGAFVVGLILSESEYCHHLVSDILPFRDFFSSLFFVSIGMMLKLSFVGDNFLMVMGITLAVFVVKGMVNITSIYLVERSWYRSIVSGLRLNQVGEFSFVMLGGYVGSEVVPENVFQAFLTCSILTMLVTPFLIPASVNLAKKAIHINPDHLPDLSGLTPQIHDHVIVVGFGHIGQYLCRILKETHIPFIIIDLDHETISAAQAQGLKAVYGDLSRPNILELAGVRHAKSIVYTVGTCQAIKNSILAAREKKSDIYILVKSGATQEVVDYLSVGVNRVISSEFETTVEMFSRILNEFEVPDNLISHYVQMARVEGYGMFRGIKMDESHLKDFYAHLAKSTTITYMILENSPWVSQSLADLGLEEKSGAVVISIIRGQKYFTNPEENFQFQSNDLLVLVGAHRQLDKAKGILNASIPSSALP
jgi:CPA2 family monovalent cation:H+ antiporter-2